MYCCFRGNKKSPRHQNRGADGVTAVNEDYMQWSSHERINGILRGHRQQSSRPATASEDNLYIDPDEVPQHLRQQQPPPPPPPTQPRLGLATAGGGVGLGDVIYAELETDALTVPQHPDVPLPPPQLSQSQPPPSPPPSSQAGGDNVDDNGDRDEGGNIIYSDIVGVLRPNEA